MHMQDVSLMSIKNSIIPRLNSNDWTTVSVDYTVDLRAEPECSNQCGYAKDK